MGIGISVIIPTYNRKDMLEGCLKSIFSQDYNTKDYEVIVVDDASSDGTSSIVKIMAKKHKNLRLIRNRQNMGPAYSRNRGIKKSRGNIIAFTDDDCSVDNDWLRSIKITHKNFPQEYGIGGKIIGSEIKSPISRFRTFQIDYSLKKNKLGERHVRYIPTCNVSYKKSVFKKIGFFDETYRYSEDIDFNMRLEKIGRPICFNEDITVFHRYQRTLKKFLNVSFSYGRFIPRIKKKYPKIPLIVPLDFISWAAFLFVPLASIFLKTISVRGLMDKILLFHLIVLDEVAYRYGIINELLFPMDKR